MYGRYGNDQFNLFLSIFSLVLVAINFIIQIVLSASPTKTVIDIVLFILIIGIFALATFRSMSKQIYKRRRENGIFLNVVGKLKRFFTLNTSSKTKSPNKDDASYIFRDCTKCSCTLRLPRKKGRNKVKCPKCGHKFYVIAKK